jgi:hypothetical protein
MVTTPEPTPFELLRRHELIQSALEPAPGDDLLDNIHAAHQAGYDLGYAAGQMAASIDLARGWCLELAHDAERQAIDAARARHGDEWADSIRAQARPAPARHTTNIRRLGSVSGL